MKQDAPNFQKFRNLMEVGAAKFSGAAGENG